MSHVTLPRKTSLRSEARVLGVALCFCVTSACEGNGSDDGGSGGRAEAGSGSGGEPQAGAGSGGRAQAGSGSGGEPQAGAGSGGEPQAGAGGGGEPQAGKGGAGNGGQAGNAGSGAQPPPILERPPEISRDCSITRPVAMLGITPWFGGRLIAGENGALLVRGEQTPIGQDPQMVKLLVSSLALSGQLGAALELAETPSNYISGLETFTRDAGTTAIWLQPGSLATMTYWLASFDGSGDLISPPVEIAGLSSTQPAFIRPRATGSLLFYAEYTETVRNLKLATLDASAQVSGTPDTLLSSDWAAFPVGLHPTANGYLAAYVLARYDSNDGGTFLVRLDPDGAPVGEPQRLGTGTGGIAFLDRGDETLIAWTEQQGGYENEDIAVTLRVGRFDADGNRLAPDQAVQRPIEDRYNQVPHWVDFGEEVGLLWSSGPLIYICAGCIPGDELHFVLLDDADFTPKSELLSLPNLETDGGLTRGEAVRLDDDLLIVSNVQYHTSAEGASASVRCVPRD